MQSRATNMTKLLTSLCEARGCLRADFRRYAGHSIHSRKLSALFRNCFEHERACAQKVLHTLIPAKCD